MSLNTVLVRGLATFSVLILTACAASQERRFETDWPTLQRDAGRSGFVADAPMPPLKSRWAFATEGRIIHPPSVMDGTVYLASRDSRVYALNLADGAKQWQIELEQGGISSAPTIVGNLIFAGKAEPYYFLYAFQRANGDTLWSRESGELINRPPFAVSDGERLYTHLDPEVGAPETVQVRLAALDPLTGSNLWLTPIGGIPEVAPTILKDMLLVASNDARLRALDPATGAIKWEAELSGEPVSSPLIADNRAIVATAQGAVYAIELSNGKVAWRYQFPNTTLAGNLALSGKLLLIPGDRRLLSFDISTLEPKWTFRAPAEVTAPVASPDYVYIGCANGMFYVLRMENGTNAGVYRTGGEILAAPVLVGGLALVGSSDGKLYAFEEVPESERPRTMPRPSNTPKKPSWMQNR